MSKRSENRFGCLTWLTASLALGLGSVYVKPASRPPRDPRRSKPPGRSVARVVTIGLACAVSGAAAGSGEGSAPAEETAARLRTVQDEIGRLVHERNALRAAEHGALGRIERLGAELRLREAELERVTLQLGVVDREIAARRSRMGGLRRSQEVARRYLSFRIRELYKQGPGMLARRAVGGDDVEGYLGGIRYAEHLSARDARVLEVYRADASRLSQEAERLSEDRARLATLERATAEAHEAAAETRADLGRMLERLREDEAQRDAALVELRGAAEVLQDLIAGRGSRETPSLDIRKFRGLLDWPVSGEVTAGFGDVVHPRFRTIVPHPGLDIVAEPGTPFTPVFDGIVVYAGWLRGYGLTAIVDHGFGMLTVYAHASVLEVSEGDGVMRGRTLGRVGDTGSLKGPFLYFELRRDGRPVDPTPWLRSR